MENPFSANALISYFKSNYYIFAHIQIALLRSGDSRIKLRDRSEINSERRFGLGFVAAVSRSHRDHRFGSPDFQIGVKCFLVILSAVGTVAHVCIVPTALVFWVILSPMDESIGYHIGRVYRHFFGDFIDYLTAKVVSTVTFYFPV